jgi:hypothetical protein
MLIAAAVCAAGGLIAWATIPPPASRLSVALGTRVPAKRKIFAGTRLLLLPGPDTGLAELVLDRLGPDSATDTRPDLPDRQDAAMSCETSSVV